MTTGTKNPDPDLDTDTEADNDPFPVREVATIAVINSVNSASYLMTYPFVSFMILDFYPHLKETEVGFYSGTLEGSFHIGSIIGSIFWGWFSDKYGRKPALILGLFGTIIATISFGLSPNYGTAIATRLMWGLLNGNVGVAKTALSEVCSDKHTARAFSYIGLSNGVGRVFGPALGGLLSEPAKKYSWGQYRLFVLFPYLLPCLAAAFITTLTAIMTHFFLKETLQKKIGNVVYEVKVDVKIEEDVIEEDLNEEDVDEEDVNEEDVKEEKEEKRLRDELQSLQSMDKGKSEKTKGRIKSEKAKGANVLEVVKEVIEVDVEEISKGKLKEVVEENMEEEEEEEIEEEKEKEDDSLLNDRPKKKNIQTSLPTKTGSTLSVEENENEETPLQSMLRLSRDEAILSCVVLYMGLGFTGLVSAELYPIYVLNDSEHGGFSLDSSSIGLIAMSGGPWMIIFQGFIYHRLSHYFGLRKFSMISLSLFSLCLFTTPLQSLALSFSKEIQWIVLLIHYGITTTIRVSCFTCSFVFTANSALAIDRGKVNGLGQASVSLARAIGPPLGTALFAWSVDGSKTFPFNYYFSWWICGFLVILLLFRTRNLPKWIENKRLNP